MDSDFPANSHSAKGSPEKEPKKKVERVTESDVIRRKKPLGARFKETFVQGDAQSVWGYVALDVLLPAAKDMVVDAVTQGVERMFFGDSRPSGRRRPMGYGHTPYNQMSGPGRNPALSRGPEPPNPSRASRARHNFDECILGSRVEADEVLEQMYNILGEFNFVSVGDMYQLIGVDASFVDDRWGWSDLRGSRIRYLRGNNGGYLVELPPPSPLD